VRVVVTGGTGFIGAKLVRALVTRGDDVTVLTRDPARARAQLGAGIAYEAWGNGVSSWTARVAAADAVLNLAGEPIAERWTEERLARVRESRVGGTTALAGALARADHPVGFVSVSAVGIYGMRTDDHVLDERAAHGDDVLSGICEAWEAAARKAERPGVAVTIPRMGIVLGREGGMLAKLRGVFAAGLGGPVGAGRQWLSWVHVDDAVQALLFATERAVDASRKGGDVDVGPYNVSGPKPVTMNDFARALGCALHRPALFRVPAFALRLALGEGLATALLTGQRAVPARLEREGFTFGYETIDAALADLVA
jgi:uncharacterized protein (TIGR01777 family)